MNTPRQILAYVVLCSFVIFFFAYGLNFRESISISDLVTSQLNVFPDFSQYNGLHTLSKDEYPIDDRHRRVIVVGDIHGTDKSFHALLDKLSYNAHSDQLIHVGDIVAKGTHRGSLAVLSYMSTHNVTGVRGNHDQKVIEWRAWMNWVRHLPGGKDWLVELELRADKQADEKGVVSENWIEQDMGPSRKWRKKIPDGWRMYSDHYNVARDMSEKDYAYLLSLPLILHVPTAHTYIVHAGLLPYDPTRDQTHRRQPLSHVPALLHRKLDEVRLRLLQEEALLRDIPQNNDPWATLNMRSVKKDHTVTKSAKSGTPWSDIWNEAMGHCAGFDKKAWKENMRGKSLPCRPSTVVYGHAASRGLDIKRWSFGTDSGCVYGRRLSALVLGSSSHLTSSEGNVDEENQALVSIPYGDDVRGQIVSVKCH
jgi:hypothetical protein